MTVVSNGRRRFLRITVRGKEAKKPLFRKSPVNLHLLPPLRPLAWRIGLGNAMRLETLGRGPRHSVCFSTGLEEADLMSEGGSPGKREREKCCLVF